jgi:hypothetical protein
VRQHSGQLQRPYLGAQVAHDAVASVLSSKRCMESVRCGGSEGEAVKVASRPPLSLVSPRHCKGKEPMGAFSSMAGVVVLLAIAPPPAITRKRSSCYVWLSCSSCLQFRSLFCFLFSDFSLSSCMCCRNR